MELVAVFGIGSTNFRYAAATLDGTIRTDVSVEPTRAEALPTQLCEAVGALRAATSAAVDAVAVSTAGVVDKDAGVIRKFDTPAGEVVSPIALRSAVEDAHGLPVYLDNDCTASALGEWYYGARDGHDCLVHITFGTGIGGGVVERGRLLRGEAAQAGEIGLFPVAPDHDLASTGVRGAWEAFCSGRGIPQYVDYCLHTDEEIAAGARADSALTDATELRAQDVFAAAADGDAFAQACLERIHRYNAAGLAAVCNAVNPGVVTLGGGVALNNPDVVLPGIERYLEEYLFVDRPTLRLTPLGDDIGLYGALATVRDERADVDDPVSTMAQSEE